MSATIQYPNMCNKIEGIQCDQAGCFECGWNAAQLAVIANTSTNTGSNQLASVTMELVNWLRSTGKTNKPRASRVPRKMLEAIEVELANCLRA
jgi:putative protein kinase ArgK-like GTPase of G3E family